MKEDVDYFHVYCLVGPVSGSAALMRVVQGNDFPFPSCFREHPLGQGAVYRAKTEAILWLVKTTIGRGKRRGQGLCVLFT